MAARIDKGLELVKSQREEIRGHVETIGKIAATLDPAGGGSARRQSDFDAIIEALKGDDDPIHQQMAGVMRGFRAGLFAGGEAMGHVQDVSV